MNNEDCAVITGQFPVQRTSNELLFLLHPASPTSEMLLRPQLMWIKDNLESVPVCLRCKHD